MSNSLLMKSKISPAWISVAALLVLWQIAASRVNHPALFPSVTQLLVTTLTLMSTSGFYESFLITIGRGVTAFAIAVALALPASIVALHYPFWKSFFQPLIIILRSVPVIAVVLIALLYLSPPQLPYIIGSITMLPILYQNFLSAWVHTDPKLIEMARLYHKTIGQRFRYIYFSQSKELLVAGLATATGFGWRAIIIGEVLSGPLAGIGAAMKKSQAYIDMPGLLAWTLVAVGGGFLIESIWTRLQKFSFLPKLETQKTRPFPIKKANPELKIQQLSFSYGNKPVLSDFSLTLLTGTVYLLKTSSGSGKTTLLKLIAGLLHPRSGIIERTSIHSVGFCFQDQRLIPSFTVEQNIAFSLPEFPKLNPDQYQKLAHLMELSKLTENRYKLPGELSGGEQQRVNLVRALLVQPDLLLLDEPLTGLDTGLKSQLLELLSDEIVQVKPVVVWATHELSDELSLPIQHINEL